MHSGEEVSELPGMLYYITTALARDLAVESSKSNSKIKEQKVIALRRELALLAFELQPHQPFQLFGARATHSPEKCNPPCLPFRPRGPLINLFSYSALGRLTHRSKRNLPCSPCHGSSPRAQERIIDVPARPMVPGSSY